MCFTLNTDYAHIVFAEVNDLSPMHYPSIRHLRNPTFVDVCRLLAPQLKRGHRFQCISVGTLCARMTYNEPSKIAVATEREPIWMTHLTLPKDVLPHSYTFHKRRVGHTRTKKCATNIIAFRTQTLTHTVFQIWRFREPPLWMCFWFPFRQLLL